MMRFQSLLFGLFVTACGDGEGGGSAPDAATPEDAPPIPVDAATGSATITGEINESPFVPTTAFYVLHPFANQHVVVMNEGGTTCVANEFPPGKSAIVGFPCGPAETRTYTAKASDAACEAGAPHVWILVENLGGELSELEALSGSATVTATGPLVTGTFNGTFDDGDVLDGTFSAVVCE